MADVITDAVRGCRNRVGRGGWTSLPMEEVLMEKVGLSCILIDEQKLPNIKRQSSEEEDFLVN